MITFNSSTPTNSKESNNDTTEYTSQAEHLQNSPVTKISPNQGQFPDTTGAESEFNQLGNNLKGPVQMVLKKDIIWSKKDPLHFWQSLAFTLKSEELTCVAVCCFVDKQGQNKLYIASNDPMTDSQQQEITEIINMFLNLKPFNEIAAKLLPRHLSYIIKQFRKGAAFLDDFIQALPGELAQKVEELMERQRKLSLDDMRELINLITDNRRVLKAVKDSSIVGFSETTRKMAFHLMKMVRVFEEINFVLKKVQRHQQDESLKSLKKQFQFISLNCHAELAIVKTAKDYSVSKTLYVGVSKRPCYCCSLFFKSIEENKSTDFRISIVTTHGKLYGKWNKIENCFEKEFNQVWVKVVEDHSALQKQTPQQTDDHSLVSGGSSDEDDLAKLRNKVPNRLELLESLLTENNLPEDLSKLIAKLIFKQRLSLDDMRELINLITDNRRVLKAVKDGSTQGNSETTRKMSFHLMKMVRVFEEINFVWKKVQRHQQDESLKSLKKQFQFISLNCHAELAIVKTAKDYSVSKTLYVG
ncbi:hypothetical protein HDV02_004654, partial [Globomyces sp. JEL0801]